MITRYLIKKPLLWIFGDLPKGQVPRKMDTDVYTLGQ